MKILVIDDQSFYRNIFKRKLENVGYTVVTVSSRDEAMELIRKDPDQFDCILSDVQMPGMSAVQFCKELKKLKLDHIVLFITSNSYMPESLGLAAQKFIVMHKSDIINKKNFKEVLEEKNNKR